VELRDVVSELYEEAEPGGAPRLKYMLDVNAGAGRGAESLEGCATVGGNGGGGDSVLEPVKLVPLRDDVRAA